MYDSHLCLNTCTIGIFKCINIPAKVSSVLDGGKMDNFYSFSDSSILLYQKKAINIYFIVCLLKKISFEIAIVSVRERLIKSKADSENRKIQVYTATPLERMRMLLCHGPAPASAAAAGSSVGEPVPPSHGNHRSFSYLSLLLAPSQEGHREREQKSPPPCFRGRSFSYEAIKTTPNKLHKF